MQIRKLRMDEVEFSLLVHPEHTPIEGNALASGDEETDQEAEREIARQLAAGNEWAWCMVEVKAEWRGFTASDYLGCCSYKNEAEFKAVGYYEDMRNQALEYLNTILGEYAARLHELEIRD